ncbi:hypothetical protein T02_2963 [Trichinella nativa]|uniref:Uncharacterized protein n=3 Tax=Trichinella TaxID=6333 RepID=A0A0V1LG31_9BILA|nr:hypothetical protein T03_16183 [Trichinella britovi]KRZ58479.1 hypothetical protein T02_2963 [Trichinella nativa]
MAILNSTQAWLVRSNHRHRLDAETRVENFSKLSIASVLNFTVCTTCLYRLVAVDRTPYQQLPRQKRANRKSKENQGIGQYLPLANDECVSYG